MSATDSARAARALADGWFESGLSSDLPDRTRREVLLGGRPVVLIRVEGTWYALDGRCPHRGGELAQGDLCGHLLHCPLHAWPFDVRTGTCHEQPGAQLGMHEVRVKEGELHVRPCATLRTP